MDAYFPIVVQVNPQINKDNCAAVIKIFEKVR